MCCGIGAEPGVVFVGVVAADGVSSLITEPSERSALRIGAVVLAVALTGLETGRNNRGSSIAST